MKIFITTVLTASITILQPLNAADMLPAIECSANPAQLLEKILCPSGSFDVDEARRFLFQLKREVRTQHGIDLDLQFVVDEALRVMRETGQFTQEEIDTAKKFYSQLIGPKEMIAYSKGRDKGKKQPDFVLPDKMALGFVCIVGGTLLCCLPFGITQGIGTGLIGTGIYSIMDGAREGEKPYYVDSETGQPIPPNNQPGPSIGIGKDF